MLSIPEHYNYRTFKIKSQVFYKDRDLEIDFILAFNLIYFYF